VQSAQEILVVGAGISGLSAALLLSRAGRRVRVIEQSARPGGLAAAERFRGIPCDLGSHRLHPAALDQPLFREIHAARPFLWRPRRGVLLFADRRLPYPPGALSMLGALGLRTSLSVGLGLAEGARRRAFHRWERDRAAATEELDIGFERFVIERVGERAYRAFYKPYAEKVWGLDPKELSQTVAKKRISTTRPWALVRSSASRLAGAFTSARGGAVDAVRIDRFVYPAEGIASIIGYIEEQLAARSVPVECGRPFRRDEAPSGPVLFAGNLGDLVETPLEHRGLYVVYVALPIARLAAEETYYSPDPRYWFGRVSELQNYSPALRRDGETILCIEIPEGTFGPGVDFSRGHLLAELLDQLTRAGILPRRMAEPLEVRQRFLPFVYPLYRRGWITAWREAMRKVAELGRILPFGRQALFLHCNLDHCADIAQDAVAHVEAGGSVERWIDQAANYLELRVRD
jgi:hypothetical protein